MLSLGTGRNRQLLVAVVEILLRKVEAIHPEHLRSNRRCGTVAADHNLSFERRLFSGFFIAQSYGAGLPIVSGAPPIEMNRRTLFLRSVYERDVQLEPGNRIDDLGFILPIRLEGKRTGNRMHHPPLHWDDDIPHPLPQAGLWERIDRKSTRLNSSHVESSYAVFC